MGVDRRVSWAFLRLAVLLLLAVLAAGCGASEAEESPLIVLFTDHGAGGYALAEVRSEIYEGYPQARVSDGAVGMPAFDLTSAGYIVSLGSATWPAGTIVVGAVNPGNLLGSSCLVALSTDGHVFLAPDNGLLTLVAQDPGLEAVYRIEQQELFKAPLDESPAESIMAQAAALLASGTKPAELGPAVEGIKEIAIPEPSRKGSVLRGSVVFVTNFGDCLTNIPAALVAETGLVPGDRLVVTWDGGRAAMPLGRAWGDVAAGKPVAVLEGGAPLKLGISQGDFSATYGLKAGTAVRIAPLSDAARERPPALAAAQRSVQSALDQLDRDLADAADGLQGAKLDGSAARRALRGLAGEAPEVVGFATVGASGAVLAIAPEQYRSYEGRDLSGEQGARRLRRARPILSATSAAPDGVPVVALLHPVLGEDGAPAGAVGGLIDTAAFLGGLVEPFVKGAAVDSIWVVDTTGEVLYDPDPSQIGLNVLTDPAFKQYPDVVGLVRTITRQPSGSGTYRFPAEGKSGEAVVQEATWVSAGLYGTAWRLVAARVAGEERQ